MAKLSQQRMGEIALALLMLKMERDGGIKIGPDLRRELGEVSKKTDIPLGELEEFSKEILIRFIGKAYPENRACLAFNDHSPYCFDKGKQ
jgi:hypothetical protein